MLRKTIPTEMFTDSLALFQIIPTFTGTMKRRLQIDRKCAKNAYEARDIEIIYFTRSEHCLAGSLGMIKANFALLYCMSSGKNNDLVKQCIYRLHSISLVDEKSENAEIYI